jgi:hypothetical protein
MNGPTCSRGCWAQPGWRPDFIGARRRLAITPSHPKDLERPQVPPQRRPALDLIKDGRCGDGRPVGSGQFLGSEALRCLPPNPLRAHEG